MSEQRERERRMSEPLGQQIDWVGLQAQELVRPPHQRRIVFEHATIDPAVPPDPLRPQMAITRTQDVITEVDIAPPEGYALSLFVTQFGSVHISLRKKS